MVLLSLVDLVLLVPLVIAAVFARFVRANNKIGLGPHPLINNVYHAQALRSQGFDAQTYVTSVYHITSDFDQLLCRKTLLGRGVDLLYKRAYWHAIFNYSTLYIYFNGGPLGSLPWLWRLEPFLLKLAAIKTVVMPYGSDVQTMARCQNLPYVDAISRDYPEYHKRGSRVARRVRMWESHANAVISGCDWVDYMDFWQFLVPAHFSIDTQAIQTVSDFSDPKSPMRVFHAPNHRAIKGTVFIESAVRELQAEGFSIELVTVEKKSNDEVQRLMRTCDIVADQLIIGWYAMFALEGMAMGKPVICYLREDLCDLYRSTGAISENPPLISATPNTIKETLRDLTTRRAEFLSMGMQGRRYAEKYHSLEAVGLFFSEVNATIGVYPKGVGCGY